jgi:hypothetical protein
MPQTFGISCETESNWPDALSDAHLEYILNYLEIVRAHEAAVIDQFLAAKDLR